MYVQIYVLCLICLCYPKAIVEFVHMLRLLFFLLRRPLNLLIFYCMASFSKKEKLNMLANIMLENI